MTIELDIVRLGAQGDGIAETADGLRFVPFTLPGERVRLADVGMLEIISAASPERTTPVCRHFGVCGGCVAQHMRDPLYADWKRGIVTEALRQHGLQAEVAALRRVPLASRRRAVFSVARAKDASLQLGYQRRKSTEIVDIQECPILAPAIVDRLQALRTLAANLPGRDVRMTVLATRNGLDIALNHAANRSSATTVAALAKISAEHQILRIAINDDIVLEHTPPVLSFAGVDVVPPPGAFVQAAQPAEDEITRLILEAVGSAKRVADLFCGVGTFTFPLARRARVLAADGDQTALAALGQAAARAQGLKPIETKHRDLFREPLSAQELRGYDAVVFDPPRAGAKAQAEKLARSTVPLVVAVSCDPGTLARDLRVLVDGGYAIETVTPIDQFLFSAHVEVVAVLRRR